MTVGWTMPVDGANPWSDEFWSIGGQEWYEATFGTARAAARARDAGTYIGAPASNAVLHPAPIEAPSPSSPSSGQGPKFAPVAVIRPGPPAIYELPDPKD
jgi:hypothetical protein